MNITPEDREGLTRRIITSVVCGICFAAAFLLVICYGR